MTDGATRIDRGQAAQIRELVERRLSAEEVRRYLSIPISDREREETLALVSWFRRRYPTPAERLAYVRDAHARWTAALPASS